jgi:hypothetical protein
MVGVGMVRAEHSLWSSSEPTWLVRRHDNVLTGSETAGCSIRRLSSGAIRCQA